MKDSQRAAIGIVAVAAGLVIAFGAARLVRAQSVPAVNTAMGCSTGQVTGNVAGSFGCITVPNGSLAGTTGSIGGALLAIGCTSGTVTVTGAAPGMAVIATPLTFPGNNIQWQAYVSGANTVTVSLCTPLTLTPAASVYYVRVIQ